MLTIAYLPGEQGGVFPQVSKISKKSEFLGSDKEIFGQNQNFWGSDKKIWAKSGIVGQ